VLGLVVRTFAFAQLGGRVLQAMTTILIVVLVVLLLGGGGYGFSRRGRGL